MTSVDQLQALLGITESITAHQDLGLLLKDIAGRLRGIVNFETISIMLHDPARNVMRLELHAEPGLLGVELGDEFFIEGSPHGLVWETQKSLLIHDVEHETRFPQITETLRKCPHRSYYVLPLTSVGRRLGAIAFGNKSKSAPEELGLDFLQQVARQVAVAVDNALISSVPSASMIVRSSSWKSTASKHQDTFTPEATELLSETARQISIAVENSLTFREAEVLRDRLAGEKQYLEEEIQTEYNFEEIVGRSAALKRVLKQVETVASTDSTVLLQGESGTGKELIAGALHNLS